MSLTPLGPAPPDREPGPSAGLGIDEHTLVGLVERLSRRFPHLHPTEVVAAITDWLAETRDATVPGFPTILAERSVARRLVAATGEARPGPRRPEPADQRPEAEAHGG